MNEAVPDCEIAQDDADIGLEYGLARVCQHAKYFAHLVELKCVHFAVGGAGLALAGGVATERFAWTTPADALAPETSYEFRVAIFYGDALGLASAPSRRATR